MWHVYILKCSDNTLYTGVTNNLERRVKEHNDSKLAAKYTRARRPVRLLYSQKHKTRAKALQEEYKIKQKNRQEKEKLVKIQN
jgi:putative endonuclease